MTVERKRRKTVEVKANKGKMVMTKNGETEEET
jgi:hypothetical protein